MSRLRWHSVFLTGAVIAAVAAAPGAADAVAGGAAKLFDTITSRPVSVEGETFGSVTVKAVEPAAHDTVLWAGLNRSFTVDDQVDVHVTHQDGTTADLSKNFNAGGGCSTLEAADSIDLNPVLRQGTNVLTVTLKDTCGVDEGTTAPLYISGGGTYSVMPVASAWTPPPPFPAVQNPRIHPPNFSDVVSCLSVGLFTQPIIHYYGPQLTPKVPAGPHSPADLETIYQNAKTVGGTAAVQTDHFACGTGSARVVLERYLCKRNRGCDFWQVAASSWELLPDTGTRVYRAVSADRVKGSRYRLGVEVNHSTVDTGKNKPRPGTSGNTYYSAEKTL